jgi:tellurite resistance protein TerC
MSNPVLTWTVFNLVVLVLLMLDLGVFHKNNRVISIKESLVWSVIWILVALVFNGVLYFTNGTKDALEFLTVYIVERSLSMDNIFVFLLIFSYFKIAAEYQYKVLFWGILGALVMRLVFILAGVSLVNQFHWMIYVFGALLVYIGIKLAFQKEAEVHPEKNPVLNLVKKVFPISNDHEGGKFVLKRAGKYLITPLLLVLVVVETTDIIFAVDSIPAALAISNSSFVIYSANAFAILGLRALYFALAGCMNLFCYLDYGLSAVLTFIGVKMVLSDVYEIPIGWALGIVAALLTVSILASIVKMRVSPAPAAKQPAPDDLTEN